jgi:hypothetical protein
MFAPGSANAAAGAVKGATSGNSFGQIGSDIGAGNYGAIPGDIGKALSSNANWLIPGAALGYEALRGNQLPKGENAISSTATQLGQQATQLESYLQSGTLPPGISTALRQAATSAEATIRAQYAARGMSGSSAETQDLANVQNRIVSQGASIAESLLSTGIQEAGLASSLYAQIMQTSLAQDQRLGNAFTSLAAASVMQPKNPPPGTTTTTVTSG